MLCQSYRKGLFNLQLAKTKFPPLGSIKAKLIYEEIIFRNEGLDLSNEALIATSHITRYPHYRS